MLAFKPRSVLREHLLHPEDLQLRRILHPRTHDGDLAEPVRFPLEVAGLLLADQLDHLLDHGRLALRMPRASSPSSTAGLGSGAPRCLRRASMSRAKQAVLARFVARIDFSIDFCTKRWRSFLYMEQRFILFHSGKKCA
jgi:hypothetical protein